MHPLAPGVAGCMAGSPQALCALGWTNWGGTQGRALLPTVGAPPAAAALPQIIMAVEWILFMVIAW